MTLPITKPGNFHVYNQYTIRASKRDDLWAYLKEHGVGTEVYYPLRTHLLQSYRDLGYLKGAFPVSERAADEVLTLPIYAELPPDQLEYVVDRIEVFYR